MRRKTTLCACIAALLTARFAVADPVGAVAVNVPSELADSLGLSVCRVYVQFDSPNDNLLLIGFAQISTNDPLGYYQHEYGGDTAPNGALCQPFPELCLDSFVTIGVGTEGGGNDATAIDPDFNSCAFNCLPTPPCKPGPNAVPAGCGELVGSWYNADPSNGQGNPDANLQVLVAQLTVRQGFGIAGDRIVFFNDGTVQFPASFECFAPCESDATCDDGSTCTTDACVDGQCSNTSIDCGDGDPCTVDGCDFVSGQCAYMPLDCDDGNPCTDDACEQESGCTHVFNTGPCSDADLCTTGDTCVSGVCVGGTPVDCDDGDACTMDDCNPRGGLCFHNDVSCPPGQVCLEGVCGPCESDAQCDDDDACTIDQCNSGVCSNEPIDCDDGDPSTIDLCIDGVCMSFPTPCGIPGSGDCCVGDNTPGCENTDCCVAVCAVDPFCCDVLWDNICAGEASDLCGDLCSGGAPAVCGPGAGACCVENYAPGCEDVVCCGLVCAQDAFCCDVAWDAICGVEAVELCPICQGSSNCCVAHDGQGCDDPACQATVCAVDPFCCFAEWISVCARDAAELCGSLCAVGGDCIGDAECDDSNACTIDQCVQGLCENELIDCQDGDPSTIDLCIDGVCMSFSTPCGIPGSGDCCVGDGTPGCEDVACCVTVCAVDPFCCDVVWDHVCGVGAGQYCGDLCAAGDGCYYDADCEDGVACTIDVCTYGECSNAPSDAACNDGNVCTDDACNPASGCMYTANSAPCTDDNACTGPDTCQAGTCVGGPPFCCCDDYNLCTIDDCSPLMGCTHTPIVCEDNNTCTYDYCDPYYGCYSEAVNVSDDNECTIDSCDPASGAIFTPVECDDGIPCTVDSCDPASGCVYEPVECPDGEHCEDGVCVSDGAGYVLDILAKKCPNKFKYPDCGPSGGDEDDDGGDGGAGGGDDDDDGGSIEVYIVGDAGAPAEDIDRDTIQMRECGGAESIQPADTPRLKDKVGPYDTECGDCSCAKLGKDGIKDIEAKFNGCDIAGLIGDLPDGTSVDLEVYGSLNDGTPFTAHDCIVIKRSIDGDEDDD